jgi:hypothetical protein
LTFPRLARLPASARVYLISDLHLGDGGPSDAFGRKDDRLRALFDEVAQRGDALVIGGDGFDVAQAWSIDRILEAHRAVAEDLARLAEVVEVHYLAGNHEGSGAALARALPLRYAHALEIGGTIRVEHGNAYDPYNLPGDQRAFWGSRVHAVIERAIRSPVRIPMRKHHAWSTRLGHWLFYRYGQLERGLAQLDHARGRPERARRREALLDYWGRGEWGDVHGLLGAAEGLLASSPRIDTVIFGHSHQPGSVVFPGGRYANTGSWTFDESTYAVAHEGRVEVRTFPARALLGDEEYRGVLGRHAGKSFFDWWRTYYRGWLSYDVQAMRRHARGE